MTAFRRSLARLLRTVMVGLLVLGVVAKPVIGRLCEAHELSHLVAAANDGGPVHVDSPAELRSDQDHASGRHLLLHAEDNLPAWVQPLATLSVPPIRFAGATPAPVDEAAPPARRPESPFRPPIA
jgi:hypothetical protein